MLGVWCCAGCKKDSDKQHMIRNRETA